MKTRQWLCIALAFTLCLLPTASLISCDETETPPVNDEEAESSEKPEIHEYHTALYLRANPHEALRDSELHKNRGKVLWPYSCERADADTSRDDFPETFALTVQGIAYTAKKEEYTEKFSQGGIERSADYTLFDSTENVGGTLKLSSDGEITIRLSVNSDDEKVLTEQEYIHIAEQELLAQGIDVKDYRASAYLTNNFAVDTCVYFSRDESVQEKDASYFIIPSYDICFTFRNGSILSITYRMPSILQVAPSRSGSFDYEKAKAAVDAWISQKSKRRDMNVYDIRLEARAEESPVVRATICREIDSDHGYVDDAFFLYLYPVDQNGTPIFTTGGG